MVRKNSTFDKHNQQLQYYFEIFEKYYKIIKRILISLVILVLGMLLVGLIVSTLYFKHLTHASDPISDNELRAKLLDFPGNERLNIKNKDLLSEYNHSENSLIVGPDQVSPHVIKALVASEDSLFFQHRGVMPKAVFRAIIQDLFDTKVSSGGSTITQQVVKNQVLTNQKTYSRKANELMLAMRTEKLFSKEEILFTYLNIVPFGRDYNGVNISGIAPASYSLFGKSSNNLNLAESAYIVGLLQSPYYYTPYDESGNLKSGEGLHIGVKRQRYVLKRMLVEREISQRQFHEARSYNIIAHLRTAN